MKVSYTDMILMTANIITGILYIIGTIYIGVALWTSGYSYRNDPFYACQVNQPTRFESCKSDHAIINGAAWPNYWHHKWTQQ